MTTAASVACGIRPISGASKQQRRRACAAAVTSAASCVRAPARRFTAVCDVPPPAGMAPKRPPTRVGERRSRAAPGWRRRAARRSREGAAGGDGLGEAHQRDAERAPARAARTSDEVGQRERRQAARDRARPSSTPEAPEPSSAEPAMPAATATSGAGSARQRSARGRPGARSWRPPTASVGSRASAAGARTIASTFCEEAALVEVDAEQLRHLVEDDHEPDAGLEADEHRLGDEVGDEAQPQQRGQRRGRRRPAARAWRPRRAAPPDRRPGATWPSSRRGQNARASWSC